MTRGFEPVFILLVVVCKCLLKSRTFSICLAEGNRAVAGGGRDMNAVGPLH